MSVASISRKLPGNRARASYLTRASSMTPKSYTDVSDQQVVVFAQEGREDAYRELIKRYERPVFSLISHGSAITRLLRTWRRKRSSRS